MWEWRWLLKFFFWRHDLKLEGKQEPYNLCFKTSGSLIRNNSSNPHIHPHQSFDPNSVFHFFLIFLGGKLQKPWRDQALELGGQEAQESVHSKVFHVFFGHFVVWFSPTSWKLVEIFGEQSGGRDHPIFLIVSHGLPRWVNEALLGLHCCGKTCPIIVAWSWFCFTGVIPCLVLGKPIQDNPSTKLVGFHPPCRFWVATKCY